MNLPRSVLLVVTRRIGDVLLATPLIRSLKRAWPAAAIDVLVFTGTEGVLAANPDVRSVITIAERPRVGAHLALAARILRRYDIALSAVPSDRPTVYAWLAGRWRAGLVLDQPKHRWKTWLLQRWVPFDNLGTHTVLMHLALANALGIPAHAEVVAAWHESDRSIVAGVLPFPLHQPYAVLHTFPKFNYKMWHRTGWVEIGRWLRTQNLCIVLTGGGDADERAYVHEIASDLPEAIDVSGKLTLSQAACLLAGARVYVGPDTALTHIAAALGVPVVTMYGPTDPLKWGPWPAAYSGGNPWRRHGSQRVDNVTLIQGSVACVPCRQEGCDRHIASDSDCLRRLPSGRIIAALASALHGSDRLRRTRA